ARAVDPFDIEPGGDVPQEQPAGSAAELEGGAGPTLDRGAVELDVAVFRIVRKPAVVGLRDQIVVRLVDRELVANSIVEIHQPRTAGTTSDAKRSNPSRSKGARIARITHCAPAATYAPTLSTISCTLPDNTPGLT